MQLKFLILFTLITHLHIKSQSLVDSIIKLPSLQQTVYFLSHDNLKGRFTGSAGSKVAAKFIAAKFDSLGLKHIQGNSGSFNISYDNFYDKKVEIINVMAGLYPTIPNDTIIIFSAHYDHIGQGSDIFFNTNFTSRDSIFNGADDNATGVAALLELAKYYAAKKNNQYILLFIAFSGEELGMLGSKYLSDHINSKLVKAVINLDMLGRPIGEKCFIISSQKIYQSNKTTVKIPITF
jgi:acetylornithine deacetylase/succinyl-diaminopimelate desuccinylase-like protein